MFCHKCGAEIPDESQFCSKCGAKVTVSETESLKTDSNNILETRTSEQIKPKKKSHWFLKLLIILFAIVLLIGLYDVVTLGLYAYSTTTYKNDKELSAQDKVVFESLFIDSYLIREYDDYFAFDINSGLGVSINDFKKDGEEHDYIVEASTSGNYAYIHLTITEIECRVTYTFKKVPFKERLQYYLGNII